MKNLRLLLVLFTLGQLYGQSSMAEIINRSNNFAQIIQEGEAYFQAKHPGIPLAELALGEERDGEYVKFRRWQHFWSERLNPDGTLGDPTAHFLQQSRPSTHTARSTNPYANINWTNINYTNFIVTQIALGRTTSMAFHPTDPNTFYVGAAIGGIWKTTDGGLSYTPLGDELPFMAVSSIVVDQNNPSTIYIAISDHVWYGPSGLGVYKSTDGGQSWSPTALAFSFTSNVRVYWMEAAPSNPNLILVATSNGLYRTTDGFNTVSTVSNANCWHVRFESGNDNIVHLGDRNGNYYRSSNAGASFGNATNMGSGNVHIDVSAQNPKKVVVKVGTALSTSTDGGLSFNPSGSLVSNGDVFKLARSNDDIILFGNFEIYRSNNGGGSNSVITNWLGGGGLPLIHVDQRNIFTNPLEPNAVYFCNDGGVYRYHVDSEQFDNLSDGLVITQYYDIAVAQSDPNVVGAGSQDNGNVFRNSNGQWSQYAGTGDGMNQDIDPTNANIRYWSYQNGGMRRWQNGSNFGIAPPGQDGNGAWETPYKVDPNTPNRLICGFNRVYESNNRGDSWSDISNTIFGGNLNELAIAPSNSNRIYATRGSNLYVKDVSNNNWTSKSLPASISDIEVDFQDMNTIYVSIPGYSSGNKVYKSTDAGDSWTNISANLPNVSTGALELVQGTNGGVLVGNDEGVWYKDEQAQVWLSYGDLPNTRVEDIEIQYSAGLIRVGTHGRGVLEAPLEIQACGPASPDGDGDGFCDFIDQCPTLDNNLIGTACDDGDPFSQGELYDTDCGCSRGAAFVNYCAGSGSSGTGSDWITQVQVADIDHSSGKTQYSDFRHITTELIHGNSYPISVRYNFAFNQDRTYIWVDWDRNETFDLDERVELSGPSNNIYTGNLMVPLDAVKGAVTMRVRATYFNLDDPCGTSAGEVEDYTLRLICAPASTNAQCGGPLPVDWVSFNAHAAEPASAMLYWQTANEINLASYQVERSFDGRQFEAVAQLSPLAREQANYHFKDQYVDANTAYYRIRAIDFDGSSQLTNIQQVKWKGSTPSIINIFPNPATDIIDIDYAMPTGSEQSWQIISADGKVVASGKLSSNQSSINISLLPAGTYLFKIGNPLLGLQQRFVKK